MHFDKKVSSFCMTILKKIIEKKYFLANSFFEVLRIISGESVEKKITVFDAKVICQQALYFPIHIFSLGISLPFFKIVDNVIIMSFYDFPSP